MNILNMKFLSSKKLRVGAATLLISKLLYQAQNFLILKEPQEKIKSLAHK